MRVDLGDMPITFATDTAVQFLEMHLSKIAGGPKLVRERIEQIDQCIAERALILPSIREWLRTAR